MVLLVTPCTHEMGDGRLRDVAASGVSKTVLSLLDCSLTDQLGEDGSSDPSI